MYNIVWHCIDGNGKPYSQVEESFSTQEEADKALLRWIRLSAYGWYTIEEEPNTRESIKTKFTWDDLDDSETFSPCQYCHAEEWWPCCDDGATSSACNHCMFNIIDYCRSHNV